MRSCYYGPRQRCTPPYLYPWPTRPDSGAEPHWRSGRRKRTGSGRCGIWQEPSGDWVNGAGKISSRSCRASRSRSSARMARRRALPRRRSHKSPRGRSPPRGKPPRSKGHRREKGRWSPDPTKKPSRSLRRNSRCYSRRPGRCHRKSTGG